MRLLTLIFGLAVIGIPAFAQDSTAHKNTGVISTIRQTIQSTQEKIPPANVNISSATDTLKTPKPDSLAVIRKLDSLKQITTEKKNVITEIRDSIQNIVNLPNDKVNQVNAGIRSRADSVLMKLNKPADDLDAEIDEREEKVRNKLSGAEDKAQDKVTSVQNDLQQDVNKATDNKLKLQDNEVKPPGQDALLPDNINTSDLGLPETDVPSMNLDAPRIEVPSIETPQLPETRLDANSLAEKADVNLDGITSVGNEINKVDGALADAEKYEDEIKNIKENGLKDAEKLPEEIEKRAGNIEGIKTLETGKQKAKEYQSVIQRYKDEKLLQEEIKRKAKTVANDKLNQFSPAFKEAQEQIGNARRLKPGVQALKESTRRQANTMKGKPFRQRFIPGITLQGYNNDRFTLDLAAQAGYRLSGRLTMGLGYTYRISISDKNINIIRSEGITGYRFYTDFRLIKSFFVHGDYEILSLDRRKQLKLLETTPTQVHGSYFGLGKRYNVSRKVKGSIMGLYRVNYKGEAPGISKFTLRIGFDYNLSYKKRKFNIPK